MATLRQAASRLEKISTALEADVNQLATDIVSGVAGELARNTPVDTALARSNWITSTGAPHVGVLFPYKPYPSRYSRGPRGGRRTGGNFRERINTNSVIEQARVAMIRRRPDETIYITNNVDYIGHLNDGKSQQAPAGFVQRAVIVGSSNAIRKFKFRNLRAA
jgi:hypothetical protein